MRAFMGELHLSYVKTALVWVVLTAVTVLGAAVPPGRSDAEIASVFRAKLAKSKLVGDGIEIKVERGVATLRGKTEILQHKGTATRMAKSSGATEVRNQIVISDAAKKAAVERLASARQKASTAGARPVRATGGPPPAVSSARESKAVVLADSHVPPPVRRAVVKH